MKDHIKWWNSLTEYKRIELAEDHQWTTVEDITDHQIELIYKELQEY